MSDEDEEQIFKLLSDLTSPSAQRQIEDAIRMSNVESNMQCAVEHTPESFVQVHMLYVDCKVNGYPVKAFVDTGAQMSIMSKACAERCQILRLVDNRWAGIALGVGTQTILGRVHLCQIQIGNIFIHSSFSILEHQVMDMLLGLDMLRRHQCVLDLKNNLLAIGTIGTVAPFLAEVDLPEYARVNQPDPLANDERMFAETHSPSACKTGGKMSDKSVTKSMTVSSQQHKANFSEEVITSLMSNGFSRSAVLEELRRCNGNTDQALAILLSKSFSLL